MNCKRCGGWMMHGEALENTPSYGVKDFPGHDLRGQTMTMNGPARIVSVLKCAHCGYSVKDDKPTGQPVHTPSLKVMKITDPNNALGNGVAGEWLPYAAVQLLARRILPHMERSLGRTVKDRDKAVGKPVHGFLCSKAAEKLAIIEELRAIAGNNG